MKNLIPWRKKDASMTPARESANPFELLHRQMNELFEDFFKDSGPALFPDLWRGNRDWPAVSPRFDVSETDEAVSVSAELPGMEEKDVEVTLDERSLSIKGEKKAEREETRKNYYLSERSYGHFQRTIPLPEGVDRDKAKAQFKKGVLTVTLPKTAQAKKEHQRITVTSE